MGRVRQAGAVAYRAASPEPLWLVATSRRAPPEWVFPKGHVEPAETVAYFLVESLVEGEAGEGRRLRWVSFADAQRLLTHTDARALLGRAAQRLSEGPS